QRSELARTALLAGLLQGWRLRQRPPIKSESASNQERRQVASEPSLEESSFSLFSILVQELPQFDQLLLGGLASRERSHQECFGRTIERPFHEVASELLLGPLAWLGGFVNVGSLLLVTSY